MKPDFGQWTPGQSGGDLPLLQLTDPMGKNFTANAAGDRWHCTKTGVDIAYALLSFYRQYGGVFGLPVSGEIYLQQYPQTALQYCERGILVYDKADPSGKRQIDSPPGAGDCYLLHIDSGIGQQAIAKPLLTALNTQIGTLTAQVATLANELTTLKVQPATDTSALEQHISDLTAQLASYKQVIASAEATLAGAPK